MIQKYVKSRFVKQINVSNAIVGGYEEGWLGVSADVGLNETRLINLFGEEQQQSQNFYSEQSQFFSLEEQDDYNHEAIVDLGALLHNLIANQGRQQFSEL
eukprot:TRINITY_DN12188_c1_g7_i1.p3 TRINITY_DN12188_c1_g7~~TRINITY_DN12188_c1_g7_i1.p3  ORF type:complete len:115 (-),score=34.21 TRINITY_DN12188_c1_g7_i1:266-565(-)